jgi:methylmalonyl-CoA decarboxylase subunit alpha
MASKINKGEILAKFFDDGEYTALFADGAVSAACGYAAGQQAYAVYQNGEAVTVKDVEKNIKVLEMAAQTGCPVVTFYNSVGTKPSVSTMVTTGTLKASHRRTKREALATQLWHSCLPVATTPTALPPMVANAV